jgi:hypothetical protein
MIKKEIKEEFNKRLDILLAIAEALELHPENVTINIEPLNIKTSIYFESRIISTTDLKIKAKLSLLRGVLNENISEISDERTKREF